MWWPERNGTSLRVPAFGDSPTGALGDTTSSSFPVPPRGYFLPGAGFQGKPKIEQPLGGQRGVAVMGAGGHRVGETPQG